jgi:hypothetical protein
VVHIDHLIIGRTPRQRLRAAQREEMSGERWKGLVTRVTLGYRRPPPEKERWGPLLFPDVALDRSLPAERR